MCPIFFVKIYVSAEGPDKQDGRILYTFYKVQIEIVRFCYIANTAVDEFFKGNVQLINNFMMALAEQQIKAAFEQSEKEVTDLHSRISQGMREAKKNGTRIGITKGTTLITKKSIECKAIIQKHSKDFGGTLDNPDVIKLCGCSRNSYYKYKKEAKTT